MSERGISARKLAAQVNYDPGGLSKILSGRRRCPPHLAVAIDTALSAEGEIAAAAAAAPEPAPENERIRRALDDALAEGSMPEVRLAAWDELVDGYGHRAQDTPSPALLADLTADLAELRLEISRHRSAAVLPRLALAAARMSGLVCQLHVKSGDRQGWRSWGRTARHAAEEAGDQEALAWVTAQEASGYYYAGDMPGTVAVARAALSARTEPGAGGALAAGLAMRAYAAMGDVASALQAMYTAEGIYQSLPDLALGDSAFEYGESQLRFHEGDALVLLGETKTALPVLDHALQLCRRDDYTSWALIRLSRAACLVSYGDLDGGIAYATETLTVLDGPQCQGVISSRGRELLAALPSAMQISTRARQLRDVLDDTSRTADNMLAAPTTRLTAADLAPVSRTP
jgi:tetratricopeptide (TPR) repeat protein